MSRESGGAFGVREAAMEEQYFRRLVYFSFVLHICILIGHPAVAVVV